MRFELALAVAAVTGVTASPISGHQSSEPVQLFNFTSGIPLENSFLRSETQLLFTTLSSNNLYSLNPYAKSPEAEVVAVLPGVNTLTGVVGSAGGKVVVLGGVQGNSSTFDYSDATVFTVDFGSCYSPSSHKPTVTTVAKLPDAVLLNGVAALPAHPEIVLITDSFRYCIWRVNTDTGAVDKVLSDEVALEAPANATLPIGVNGLKIYGGHAYFTNTAAGLFARVPITEDGDQDGEVEILVTVPSGTLYDDFDIDAEGVAYLGQTPGAVVRVVPGGAAEFVIGADGDATLTGPTSIALPKGGKKAYVTTRGVAASGVSGQVFKISI